MTIGATTRDIVERLAATLRTTTDGISGVLHCRIIATTLVAAVAEGSFEERIIATTLVTVVATAAVTTFVATAT